MIEPPRRRVLERDHRVHEIARMDIDQIATPLGMNADRVESQTALRREETRRLDRSDQRQLRVDDAAPLIAFRDQGDAQIGVGREPVSASRNRRRIERTLVRPERGDESAQVGGRREFAVAAETCPFAEHGARSMVKRAHAYHRAPPHHP
jgi:hypothetical protein